MSAFDETPSGQRSATSTKARTGRSRGFKIGMASVVAAGTIGLGGLGVTVANAQETSNAVPTGPGWSYYETYLSLATCLAGGSDAKWEHSNIDRYICVPALGFQLFVHYLQS